MEALKSALKHLWKPWDVGPAVKISVRLEPPPMQRALCVCVSVLVKDWSRCYHLCILSLPPPFYFCTHIYIHSVRSNTKDRKHHSCAHLDTQRFPRTLCSVTNTVCAVLFGDLCFSHRKKVLSATRTPKRWKKIDSFLAEITLPFMLYQILFCLKGCLFASWKGILLLKSY